jgi:hypothetical protein
MAIAVAVALGVAAQAHREGVAAERAIAGVRVGGLAVGGLEDPALAAVVGAAVESSLDRPLVLRAGDVEVVTSARTLGAVGDPERARESVLALGRSGDPVADLQAHVLAATRGFDVDVGARFDERKALDQLLALAPALDRPSLPTRLDLERRRVEPAVRTSLRSRATRSRPWASSTCRSCSARSTRRTRWMRRKATATSTSRSAPRR